MRNERERTRRSYKNSQNISTSGTKERQKTKRKTNRKISNSNMSRSERQRRRIRTSRRRKILARVLFLSMTLTLAFFALTVFFKVDNITSNSTRHYKKDDIIRSLGLEKGDNMFTFRLSALEKKIKDKYPYLASVEITRNLPSTVNVKIKDSVPVAALSNSIGGYYLMDENGKILEQVPQINKGIAKVIGVSVIEAEAGEYLDTKNNPNAKKLVEITKELKKQKVMSKIDFINVSALSDVRIGYLGRIDVRLGNADKLEEKFRMLIHIVEKELSPSDVQIVHLEQADTVYCPPTTKEKIEQSMLPLLEVEQVEKT